MPACMPFVCDEFGFPKHTGHASASFAHAEERQTVNAIRTFLLIPNP